MYCSFSSSLCPRGMYIIPVIQPLAEYSNVGWVTQTFGAFSRQFGAYQQVKDQHERKGEGRSVLDLQSLQMWEREV